MHQVQRAVGVRQGAGVDVRLEHFYGYRPQPSCHREIIRLGGANAPKCSLPRGKALFKIKSPCESLLVCAPRYGGEMQMTLGGWTRQGSDATIGASRDLRRMSGRIGWHGVRLVLGVVLLAAALLKAYPVLEAWWAGLAAGTANWLVLALSELEFLVGLWLLTGIWPIMAWWTTLICFSAFAISSFVMGMIGRSHCGCFGVVRVHPWAVFSFDLTAISALWLFPPSRLGRAGLSAAARAQGDPSTAHGTTWKRSSLEQSPAANDGAPPERPKPVLE